MHMAHLAQLLTLCLLHGINQSLMYWRCPSLCACAFLHDIASSYVPRVLLLCCCLSCAACICFAISRKLNVTFAWCPRRKMVITAGQTRPRHSGSPLCLQVEAMSTAQLQEELQKRNINPAQMSKFDMQDSLWDAYQREAGLLPEETAAAVRSQSTTAHTMPSCSLPYLSLHQCTSA